MYAGCLPPYSTYNRSLYFRVFIYLFRRVYKTEKLMEENIPYLIYMYDTTQTMAVNRWRL